MLSSLLKLNKLLIKLLEITVILVIGFLVIDVLWGVFSRYVLKNQSPWTEELATMLLIWVSLLGAAIGFIRKSHLGVDYFVNKMSQKKQAIGEIVVYILIAVFASFAMIYGGTRLVALTLKLGQVSPAMQLKMGYVYMAVPISGFFILVFSIETIIKNVTNLLNKSNNQ
ncbi:MAG: TRAP transporter small permease [Sedimentisphaerales bacterium]|nr:TRAP transporter small permease [Sedimentisphaerales bacterium]